MIRLKGNKGFLLFEVLISVIILSVGLILIIEALLTSLRAVKTSSNAFKAELMLEEKLFEYELAGEISAGTGEGKFEGTIREYRWEETSKKVNEMQLNDLKFAVLWKEGNSTRQFSIETYLREVEVE